MKIVVLAGAGQSTNILLNWLEDNGYNRIVAIVEQRPSPGQIIRYRMRRLGLSKALGQILFALCIVPITQRNSRGRRQAILTEHHLREGAAAAVEPIFVDTINSVEVKSILRDTDPDVVLVNGTRIIKADILNAVPAVFLNIHAGITPTYRGVHGGYWSLWSGDRENFGVTLHMVDPGVDTGRVVAQHRTNPSDLDNFSSYPLLQQAMALPLLGAALQTIKAGQALETAEPTTACSRQWFHPTLWQYVAGYLRGVR